MKLYIKLFVSGIVSLLLAPFYDDLTVTLNVLGGLIFFVGLVGICLYNEDTQRR